MRIPEDIVSLLEALPVEEVARRLGVAVRRHMAICFMHDDHHPSLAFNPSKNTFYCFACQKGGDPIRLVQEHQGWAFPEACAWLANQFGIPLQEDDAAVPKPTIPLPRKKTRPASSTKHRQIDREVGEWLLAHVGLSPVARAVLFASRRYRPEVVRQLRIASLTDSAAMAARLERRFGSERCRTSGFFWDDEASTLIFDSPCLLFPYFTPQGELCSIQSRYLGDNPQTPRFRFPKEVRQGLFNVPVLSALRPDEPLFLAEGVTDCLALLSSGRRAVAFPAAGIHPEEDVALLAGRRLFMYPDRDDAGERLFLKLNEMLQPFATVVHRLPLDEGCKDFSDMYMAQASAQQPWDAGSQPAIGGAPSGGGLPSPKHPNNQAPKQSSPMTVKEVFDLRKQGRLEEAYEAIRPMYAVHKGKYTTLCMFWVGSDILKLRLSEKRTSEAAKIFEALLRVAPAIDDQDHKVHEAVLHDALRLKEALPTFSMLQFMQQYGVDRLTDADWQEFKERVVKSGFTFDPVSKKQFAELVKTAKFEGYYEGAKAAFDSLESKLNHDVAFALDRNEKVVRQILEADIIAAYYYQAGAIEAGLNYDNQLKEAVRLLKNPEEYKKVLAPQKTKETSSLIRLEKKPLGTITAKRQEPLIFSAIA